jgi:hypothetical protein
MNHISDYSIVTYERKARRWRAAIAKKEPGSAMFRRHGGVNRTHGDSHTFDFLLGQFHGFSAVTSLAGPTYAQIDTLMGILHGGRQRSKLNQFSRTIQP